MGGGVGGGGVGGGGGGGVGVGSGCGCGCGCVHVRACAPEQARCGVGACVPVGAVCGSGSGVKRMLACCTTCPAPRWVTTPVARKRTQLIRAPRPLQAPKMRAGLQDVHQPRQRPQAVRECARQHVAVQEQKPGNRRHAPCADIATHGYNFPAAHGRDKGGDAPACRLPQVHQPTGAGGDGAGQGVLAQIQVPARQVWG